MAAANTSGRHAGAAVQRRTYTVEEAAIMLGISRAKAYEFAHTGELPVVRFGRRLVVPASGLDRLLEVGEASELRPGSAAAVEQ
jgi:excisionase family DNA binding protein